MLIEKMIEFLVIESTLGKRSFKFRVNVTMQMMPSYTRTSGGALHLDHHQGPQSCSPDPLLKYLLTSRSVTVSSSITISDPCIAPVYLGGSVGVVYLDW